MARAHKINMANLKKKLKEFLELKNSITEIINSMKELNSRRESTEPRIIKLENRGKEITQNTAQRENMKKKLKHIGVLKK